MPTTFDLQVHTPLELHDVEVDPEELHPHAEKNFNIFNTFSTINFFVISDSEGIIVKIWRLIVKNQKMEDGLES